MLLERGGDLLYKAAMTAADVTISVTALSSPESVKVKVHDMAMTCVLQATTGPFLLNDLATQTRQLVQRM